MTKAELRKINLARQRSLSPEERTAKSRQIAERFFAFYDLSRTNAVHCFIPIEKFNEIDTAPIFHGIWKEFPQIVTAVPRVDMAANEMESLRYTAATEMMLNAWEIREPTHDEYVDADEIDIVLVPGLAFDRQGHRVGYGKGFYDRFLIKCRPDCLKIGLGYFEPVERIDDTGSFDVMLDALIMPDRIINSEALIR